MKGENEEKNEEILQPLSMKPLYSIPLEFVSNNLYSIRSGVCCLLEYKLSENYVLRKKKQQANFACRSLKFGVLF